LSAQIPPTSTAAPRTEVLAAIAVAAAFKLEAASATVTTAQPPQPLGVLGETTANRPRLDNLLLSEHVGLFTGLFILSQHPPHSPKPLDSLVMEP